MADGKRRVLIVDDASLVRRYYREHLEAAGYEVIEAFNGLEALERLLSAAADLVIVDVNMPQMDGFSFLRALRRRDEPWAALPALVISTEAGENDIEAARAAGANFYLVKPADPDKLLALVGLLCGSAE